jgi:hypothetical protein
MWHFFAFPFNKFWLQGLVVSTRRIIGCLKIKTPLVDIIGRPHTEDDGPKENRRGEHRPDSEAH